MKTEDQDTEIIDITEATDNTTSTVDDNILTSLRPDKFDIRLFHEKFRDHSEEALRILLDMQSNEQPLKKGGEGIAYRCDIFILKNRQRYTTAENTVFDIISGYVSSHPDEDTYVIYARDVKQYVNYHSRAYIYEQLRAGVEGLKGKTLEFEVKQSDNEKSKKRNKKTIISTPWYSLLTYSVEQNDMEQPLASISFTPTPLFKALLISASIVHGAFYQINASTSISSAQVRSLYYLLISKEKYQEHPGAEKGKFQMTLEELRDIIGYSETYKYSEINRSILQKAKREFETNEYIDFTMDYKPIREYTNASRKKVTVAIEFTIKHKKQNVTTDSTTDTKTKTDETIPAISNYETEKVILKSHGFNDAEIKNIIATYVKNNRDMTYLVNATTKLSTSKNIKSRCGYMCWLMEHDIDSEEITQTSGRSYDYDALEKQLLSH